MGLLALNNCCHLRIFKLVSRDPCDAKIKVVLYSVVCMLKMILCQHQNHLLVCHPPQHHHLALAAEGLAWEGDESQFSGFLAGEEAPDNLEVSVGTYIAARTETLGTLGGDPNVPRVRTSG